MKKMIFAVADKILMRFRPEIQKRIIELSVAGLVWCYVQITFIIKREMKREGMEKNILYRVNFAELFLSNKYSFL